MSGKTVQGRLVRLLLLFPLLFLYTCSGDTLNLLFDIPQPSEAEREAAEKAGVVAGLDRRVKEGQELRPEIESVLDWAKANDMLPKGTKGQIDWAEAERLGVIRPRDRIDSVDPIQHLVFKYDFFLTGEDPDDDAFFPHSTHTQWLACESCHPKVFPLRGESYEKSQMKEGRYCGTCHKKASGATFSLRACERCHLGPVTRASPQAKGENVDEEGFGEGEEEGFGEDGGEEEGFGEDGEEEEGFG